MAAGQASPSKQSRDWGPTERWVIRIAIASLLIAALAFALTFDISLNARGHPELPSVALGRELLYRAEVLLALVYAGLLLVTPFFYGVVRGKVPIEISPRGAKWAEAADETLRKTERALESLQKDATDLRGRLVELELSQAQDDNEHRPQDSG